MPCRNVKKKVFEHCITKELDHICDHLSNLTLLNEEVFSLEFSKNNKPHKGKITCPICQERIPSGYPMYRTSCEHKFHAHCFLLHSLRSEDCPVCRQKLQELEEGDSEMNRLKGHIGNIMILME